MPEHTNAIPANPEAFLQIVRYELRRRGCDGPGTASIVVKDNHATLHWLWQGRACRLSLDRHFDLYMAGRASYRRGLIEALDREFMP